MRSLTDKAVLLILANAIKYAVGFILPMVLVRLLTKEEYGTYTQLSLVSSIANGVMVLGLPMSVYYFYHRVAKDPAGRPTLIAQTQLMLLLSGVFSSIVIVMASPMLAAKMSNPALGELLPRYALFVGLFIAGEHFMHVMISQNRYVMAVGLEAAETAFRVIVMVGLLLLGFRLYELVLALVLYALLRLLIRSYWLWHGPDTVNQASWQARFPLEQLAYSLPLAATTCVGMLGGMLDRWIVAVSFTPVEFAIYSVGALEIPLDSIFQASVSNVLRASLPALASEGRTDEIIRIWRESVRKLAIIMIPSFVFLFCFAGMFITTLFTSRYAESTHVFRIYVCMMPLYMLVLSIVPQVYGKTRLNLYVVCVAMTTNVVLSLVLLRYVGILGPAIALVFSCYLSSAMFFVVTKRLLKARTSQLLPFPALARTTAASLIAVAPALGVAELIGPGLVSFACAGVTFAVSGVIAGYFLRVFSSGDIDIARSVIRRVVPGF